MEFAAGARLEVRISASDVGKRVTVRSVAEEAAPGAAFTDTVGILTSWDEGALLVTRRDGTRVRLAEDAVVAAKVVPAAPARRRGPAADYAELAGVQERGWRAVEREALGGWLLRASVVDGAGFTRRANSVLPLGDPGMPLARALDRVREWYAARGLPAYAQLATGAGDTQEVLAAALEEHGWRREVSALVMVGALAPLAELGPEPTGPLAVAAPVAEGPEAVDPGVRLGRTPDEAWLRRYNRAAGAEPGGVPPGVLAVLASGPSPWFARIDGAGDDATPVDAAGVDAVGVDAARAVTAGADAADGETASGRRDFVHTDKGASGTAGVPDAIGRCVVDGRWAGFAAVEVAPERRRRGLAQRVMGALARTALAEGASAAWLQVERDNEAAVALYTRLGFTVHHHYHHYRAPEAA
ncbi:GNAT family N-acetyltransferase [Streptomyces sp. CLI2509]|uniref:GNAT family N-acetyltransferase n=2 Tax=unclassified Streptomyces TaxID=2593676 RepID=UPI000BACA687|nr:GNAT family N-acetyltransferase [Streptomyces sp. CLI2509]ASY32921.1 GNAT family N-acetyltransferase [Streptomyces sp. CLI2509]